MISENELHQMTAEELGALFPIVIQEFDDNWKHQFVTEKEKILGLFNQSDIVSIEHIGSTAIPNLKSKPTIDILIEISKNLENHEIIEKLKTLEYQYTEQLDNPPPHMMFVKGYTRKGFKGQAYHIHIRYTGDWDEIYFRDYIRENIKLKNAYEDLKLALAKKYRNDRESYTNAKTEFIEKVIKLAREQRNENEDINHRR